MNKSLNEAQSLDLAERFKSKAKTPFDNAYRGALATQGAIYVQGFVAIAGTSYHPIEHAWIELDDCLIDPTFPHFHKSASELHYFSAQRLTVKQLKAAVEEAQEDYPEDDPLPIYGKQPYEYYGDVMLGGKEYLDAHQAAETLCRALNKPIIQPSTNHFNPEN